MWTWMALEGILLNEISQQKINTVWYHLYVESEKYNRLVNKTKRQTHRYKEQTSGYHWEEGTGRNKIGVKVSESRFSRVWLFVTPWTDCSPPGFSVHGILQVRILSKKGVRS